MDYEIRDDGRINIVMTDHERRWLLYYLGDCSRGPIDPNDPGDTIANEVENRAQCLGIEQDVFACEMRQRAMSALCDAGIAYRRLEKQAA